MGLQGVAARAYGVVSLALVEKHRSLAVPNRQLSAKFDFTGAFTRNALNHLLSGFIEPFDYFQKDHIVFLPWNRLL